MSASRAADSDGEIRFALSRILWQREIHEINQFLQERLRQRVAVDVVGDLRRKPGQRLQRRHVMGIHQEAYVEDEVGVDRDSVLEAERDDRYGQPWSARAPGDAGKL